MRNRRPDTRTVNLNRVWRCPAVGCETKYVRTYQVLERLKYGLTDANGKNLYHLSHGDETSILRSWQESALSGSLLEEQLQQTWYVCPRCLARLQQPPPDPWLDGIGDPPTITWEEYLERRDQMQYELNQARKTMDQIQRYLEENGSFDRFRAHYNLPTYTTMRIKNADRSIRKQLEQIRDNAPFQVIRSRAFFLLEEME